MDPKKRSDINLKVYQSNHFVTDGNYPLSPQYLAYSSQRMRQNHSPQIMNDNLSNSQFLLSEQSRSEKIKKKHEKEINNLLNYDNIVRQQRLQNEEKLNSLFQKQNDILLNQKLKIHQVSQMKVQNHLDKIYNQKQKNENVRLQNSAFYESQKQQLNSEQQKQNDQYFKQQISERDIIQKEQTFKKQRSYLLNNLKSKEVNKKENFEILDKEKWKEIDSFKNNKKQYLIDSQKMKNDKIDQVIKNHSQDNLNEQQQKDIKIKMIQDKIQKAQFQKSEVLDQSVVKNRQHEMHIYSVLNQSQLIQQQNQQYYTKKVSDIDEKICEKLDKKKQIKFYAQKYGNFQENYRQEVKRNSEFLEKTKNDQLIQCQRSSNELKDQLQIYRSQIIQDRRILLDKVEEERRQVSKKLENNRYPLLNSIDFESKAKHFQKF